MTEQGSAEWFARRCGKVTASRIADMMAKPRVPGQGMRANYLIQLACERVTGIPAKTYQNNIMEEAHEWEPRARAWYALMSNNEVRLIDFIDHPNIEMSGCSPDGLVGEDGLVEFKCPIANTHFATLRNFSVDAGYIKQVQFQMACSGRSWCDYVSYNEDFPGRLRGVIMRIHRDDEMIAEIESATRAFQLEVNLAASWLKENNK